MTDQQRAPMNSAPSSASAAPRSIVSWGELLWDLFPDGPRLGGGAANVAYHVARLGDRASLVSRVGGDDLGRAAISTLTAAGVRTEHVQIDAEAATGTVAVELIAGEPRFTIGQRVAWDRITYDGRIAALLKSADALCFSTLAQRTPLGAGALRQALEQAPPGCVRICDLNLRPPFVSKDVIEELIEHAELVKLNEGEAERLRSLFGASDAVEWLLQRGVRLVALTLGTRGSLLVTGDGRSLREAHVFASGGGDPVGAGDAFTAVLAHHAVRGTSLEELHAHASRYAGYVASQRGAMPEMPDELVRASLPLQGEDRDH